MWSAQAEFNEESTKLNERICELEKECDRYKTVIHRLSNKVEAANAAGILSQKYSIGRHGRYKTVDSPVVSQGGGASSRSLLPLQCRSLLPLW